MKGFSNFFGASGFDSYGFGYSLTGTTGWGAGFTSTALEGAGVGAGFVIRGFVG